MDAETFNPSAAVNYERMPVPSAFDALPAYAGKRGLAVYRTRFATPPGHPIRIEFGAVSMWCRVYVDGVIQRAHACGYAPFFLDLPAKTTPERELMVLVDNRFDFDRVPMHEEYFDFYQYGGVLRDVSCHVLPEGQPFIDSVQVTPLEGYRDGEVEIRLRVGGVVPEVLGFAMQFDGGPIRRHEARVANKEVVCKVVVPDPRVWSPDSPCLHQVRVILRGVHGNDVDDVSIRFGLRRIEVHAGALWLNGERLQLRGYNRHEWHPNLGPCTPVLQMAADLQILRDLGCNFIRGSHYPQDQKFLDLCDELGFLVLEENLGWGQREKTFASAKWREDHAESLRAMVRASCNHPSVIIWGFLNEAGTDQDYPRAVIGETVATLRSLDASRPVTYATMFALDDKHLDLVDIISINTYPGWYACEDVDDPVGCIKPRIDRCIASIDERGFSGKPILISEIGAEALYGWRDAHNDFFTEEYQAKYLQTACQTALEHPRCCGIALWHFSDVRTYSGGRSLGRPRTFNNKGTLDEYRRPKTAYEVVRRVFGDYAKRAMSAVNMTACGAGLFLFL
jgi:beta-glucuronidase